MAKTYIQGRLSYKVRSFITLIQTIVNIVVRRVIGRPLVKGWPVLLELGTLFWQKQCKYAFSLNSVQDSREYVDCLYTVLDANLDVDIQPSKPEEPKGEWYCPRQKRPDGATMLFFHGGGYAFYSVMTRHFIGMLAQTLGVDIFAPDYRLAPEHSHPAQVEDGLSAYRYMLGQGVDHKRLIVAGDSAGGHLALMTLANVAKAQLPQPALVIGISPWVDMEQRGESFFAHDCYDLVQSYQILQFAKWFKGNGTFSYMELSPIHQEYCGLSPVYIQAGAREIFVDMIRDFSNILKQQKAFVRLDVWEDMIHEFHAYGRHLPQSKEALERISECIDWAIHSRPFKSCVQTEVNSFKV